MTQHSGRDARAQRLSPHVQWSAASCGPVVPACLHSLHGSVNQYKIDLHHVICSTQYVYSIQCWGSIWRFHTRCVMATA